MSTQMTQILQMHADFFICEQIKRSAQIKKICVICVQTVEIIIN